MEMYKMQKEAFSQCLSNLSTGMCCRLCSSFLLIDMFFVGGMKAPKSPGKNQTSYV